MLFGGSPFATTPYASILEVDSPIYVGVLETVNVTEVVLKELEILVLESVVVNETVYQEKELLFTEEVVVSEFIQTVINGGSMTWVPIAKTSTTWTPLPRN